MIKVRTRMSKRNEEEEERTGTGLIVYCGFAIERIAEAIIRISDVLGKETSNSNAIGC